MFWFCILVCVILLAWFLPRDQVVLGFRGEKLSRVMIGGSLIVIGIIGLFRLYLQGQSVVVRTLPVLLILNGSSYALSGLQQRFAIPVAVIALGWIGSVLIGVTAFVIDGISACRKRHHQKV